MKARYFCYLVGIVAQSAFGQQLRSLVTIREFPGTDSGAVLGSFVMGVGDLNKDGFADVAVSARGKKATYVYFGGNPMSGSPAMKLDGGGMVAAGDFNGDSWIDLAIEKYFSDTVLVYFGGPIFQTVPSKILTMASNYYGHTLAAGDVDGDGNSELIVNTLDLYSLDSLDGRGRIFVYAGGPQLSDTPADTLYGSARYAGLGEWLAVGDIDGDGRGDIVALGYNQEALSSDKNFYYISVFLGNNTLTLHQNYYFDARRIPGGLGPGVKSFDADGDRIADILVDGIQIFKGGTAIDSIPTYHIPPLLNDTTAYGDFPPVAGGGDFNHDGLKDLLVGTLVNRVLVYLGGSEGLLQGPVAYKNFGELVDAFGGAFDNAGDVNGDGVDDIIISAPGYFNGHQQGFFGLYSGDTTLVTSVGELQSLGFEENNLQQNYPNPFNSETTIRYRIATSQRVSVRVFDVSGREIAVLVDGPEAQGEHTVHWNGLDDRSRRVASGVYFCRLTTRDQSSTIKAILIK
jgi:hypothetical protein